MFLSPVPCAPWGGLGRASTVVVVLPVAVLGGESAKDTPALLWGSTPLPGGTAMYRGARSSCCGLRAHRHRSTGRQAAGSVTGRAMVVRRWQLWCQWSVTDARRSGGRHSVRAAAVIMRRTYAAVALLYGGWMPTRCSTPVKQCWILGVVKQKCKIWGWDSLFFFKDYPR